MCSSVEDHDLVPSLPDNIKSQTHSRMSECDGRPSVQVKPSPVNKMVTASAGVQTDLSQVVYSSVDLFVTRLNHKAPLYMSPVPNQNAWDIDALNINWSCLTAYAYPPMAILHRVIQKVRQPSCLIIVITQAGQGCPGFGTYCSSQQRSHFNFQCQEFFSNSPTIMCSTASQPPQLVSRSGQLQEQGFSVEVADVYG